MAYPKLGDLITMSAEQATMYIRDMIHREASSPGDSEGAMRRLSSRYGLSFWTLDHLRKRKAKTVEAGLFAKIRAAYLAECERQVRKLQEQIQKEKALGNDHLGNLGSEVEVLASRIQEAKTKA